MYLIEISVIGGKKMSIQCINPTRAEINLDNLKHNLAMVRKIISPKTKICAVLKADGYGHGAFEVAQIAENAKISYLAVATLDEALYLRQKGIKIPILILGFTPVYQFDKIIEQNITQTVFDFESAKDLSFLAKKQGKKAKVHIKLDTGMGRLGFPVEPSTISEIIKILKLEGLEVEGLFTHFARADEKDKNYTKKQFNDFLLVANRLKKLGFSIPIKHVANSAAIIDCPETNLDMVRPGIMLYGLYPSDKVNKDKVKLKPVMTLKTKIAYVKSLSKGKSVSYGGTFVTKRQSLIATLPIGYADGYFRALSSKASVLVNGQRAPVIGRICMDQCMVDVTDIKGSVKKGDDVVILGAMEQEKILAEQLAHLAGTINYEVICSIGKRVPRVYIENGKIAKIKDFLTF